jgi:DNA-directed RNA polymerase sigma subunit (sigma70/sigma32)
MKKAAYESLLVHRPENQLKSKKPNKISVSMVDIDFKPERGNSISSMLTTDDCTDELTVDNERQKLATEFMGMLVNTERDVMNSLFMCSCESPTLRQIGMEMNVSHERVRQLKEAAIKRIRSSERYADMVAESKYLAKEAV